SLWLIIWAMGAAFVFGILNWFLFGFELIIIKNGNLKILKKIWFINLKKEYEIEKIKNIFIIKNPPLPSRNSICTFEDEFGRIKFDYGMKTIKFAVDIDEAEAKMIFEKLKRNHNFNEYNFATITDID
ncbi:hypothetical protein, partial [Oceanivirga salmonicida]|uniref:hypothetical protein n=1 Tax=Oceanivirga salmonicida TaxID=1769291 RepID=UPI0018CC6DC4